MHLPAGAVRSISAANGLPMVGGLVRSQHALLKTEGIVAACVICAQDGVRRLTLNHVHWHNLMRMTRVAEHAVSLLTSNDPSAFVQVVADAVRDIRQFEIQSNAIALLSILARRGIGLARGSGAQFRCMQYNENCYVLIFNCAAETQDDATKAMQQLACDETGEVGDLLSAALRSLA